MVDTKVDKEDALRTQEGFQVDDIINPIMIATTRKVVATNQVVEVAEQRK